MKHLFNRMTEGGSNFVFKLTEGPDGGNENRLEAREMVREAVTSREDELALDIAKSGLQQLIISADMEWWNRKDTNENIKLTVNAAVDKIMASVPVSAARSPFAQGYYEKAAAVISAAIAPHEVDGVDGDDAPIIVTEIQKNLPSFESYWRSKIQSMSSADLFSLVNSDTNSDFGKHALARLQGNMALLVNSNDPDEIQQWVNAADEYPGIANPQYLKAAKRKLASIQLADGEKDAHLAQRHAIADDFGAGYQAQVTANRAREAQLLRREEADAHSSGGEFETAHQRNVRLRQDQEKLAFGPAGEFSTAQTQEEVAEDGLAAANDVKPAKELAEEAIQASIKAGQLIDPQVMRAVFKGEPYLTPTGEVLDLGEPIEVAHAPNGLNARDHDDPNVVFTGFKNGTKLICVNGGVVKTGAELGMKKLTNVPFVCVTDPGGKPVWISANHITQA